MTEGPLALAVRALLTKAPPEKAEAAFVAARAADKTPLDPGRPAPPDRPARPSAPVLLPPGQVPRRRLGTEKGRIALLHALAHIEFNAIDLGLDMAARFTPEVAALGLDADAFARDWLAVAADEARHFTMLAGRLADYGAHYGDLPAHDGLWEAAHSTRGDLLARLSVAPMALEARGLDVTPGMIERLERAGDGASAAILKVIYREEVGHVAAGVRWFEAICAAKGDAPGETFRRLVSRHLAGGLKPPFNSDARAAAGFPASYYDASGAQTCL